MADSFNLIVSTQLFASTSWVISVGFDSVNKIDTYNILDALSNVVVGSAKERKPGPICSLIRHFFGRNLPLSAVRIFAAEGNRLAMQVTELPTLWRPSLILTDTDGLRICSYTGLFAVIGGGFVIRSVGGSLVGRIEAKTAGGPFFMVGRNKQTVGKIIPVRSNSPFSEAPSIVEYFVERLTHAADSALITVILLGAAFVLDLVYRDRVGGGESDSKGAALRTCSKALRGKSY